MAAKNPKKNLPSTGQSSCFLPFSCWFFSICCLWFAVLLVLLNIIWISGVLTFEFECVPMMRAGHARQVVLTLNLAGWWINHKTTFSTLYKVFLFVMAHLVLSAQTERDFSAASLVWPWNWGSMDVRS